MFSFLLEKKLDVIENMSLRFVFLFEVLCSSLRAFLKAYVPVGKILGLAALKKRSNNKANLLKNANVYQAAT